MRQVNHLLFNCMHFITCSVPAQWCFCPNAIHQLINPFEMVGVFEVYSSIIGPVWARLTIDCLIACTSQPVLYQPNNATAHCKYTCQQIFFMPIGWCIWSAQYHHRASMSQVNHRLFNCMHFITYSVPAQWCYCSLAIHQLINPFRLIGWCIRSGE
jgi:hypothetical protein